MHQHAPRVFFNPKDSATVPGWTTLQDSLLRFGEFGICQCSVGPQFFQLSNLIRNRHRHSSEQVNRLDTQPENVWSHGTDHNISEAEAENRPDLHSSVVRLPR